MVGILAQLAVGMAVAEPPGSGPANSPLSWATIEDDAGNVLPAISVNDIADKFVEVTLRVTLAELTTSWDLSSQRPQTDSLTLSLEVPTDAHLHAAADDYVTDLLAIVDVDGDRWIHRGYLAWPNGSSNTPVVWTEHEMRDNAPQGVLDASLRDSLLSDGDRLMPDVSDVVARDASNVGLVQTEVEP